MPLTRLGAFFVTVVVVGNVFFHTFRPSAADVTTADETSDYFLRKRKRLQKQFQKTLEKFLGFPAAGAEPNRLGESPERSTEVVKQVGPPVDRGPLQAIAPPQIPATPEMLGFVAPEPVPFVWPQPMPPPRPAFVPAIDVPRSLGLSDDLSFRADMVSDWYRRNAPDPTVDVMNVFLKGPELLIDGVFTCASGMESRPSVREWDDDSRRSITAQMLDVGIGARPVPIGREFLMQLNDREQRYFSGFSDSRVNTFAFENGTESANLHQLALDQRKVFWDALRRTYLARYKVNAEEKIKEDAWYFDRWSDWDFAVLPPLLGAYVYYRGMDRKFKIGESRLTVSIEPVSEWVRRTRDVSAMASAEWSMKGWPLGVIVSAGLHDGKYGLDFVGIGTSIGAVRQALEDRTLLVITRQ